MQKVKCVECGLLSEQWIDGTVREADHLSRKRGIGLNPPFAQGQRSGLFCHKGVAKFPAQELTQEQAAIAIATEIECTEWCHWIPGKTAMQHEEMGIVEKVRAEATKFNSRQIFWAALNSIATLVSAIIAIAALVVALKKN